MTKVWFITGASKGIGFETAQLALTKGDRVVSFARTSGKLAALQAQYPEELLILLGDVQKRGEVFAAAATAYEKFGRLDIVLSNAAVMMGGTLEETSEAEARKLMDINFFGSLWTAQATAPFLRKQKSGHFIQVSSLGGVMAWATSGLYSASKFAVEGLTEALAQELAGFGIKTTILEPGGYWTDLYKDLAASPQMPAYAELHQEMADYAKAQEGQATDSDPRLAGEAILKLVALPEPPLRLILADSLFDFTIDAMHQRISDWQKGESISRASEKLIPMPDGYLEKE